MEPIAETVLHNDGIKTNLFYFYSQEKPKASILILHGMAEHHKRYYPFAKYLAALGFDVYLYDHRGHGTDKLLKDLGYICPGKGYEQLIKDGIDILKVIRKKERCNKLILFGHSMGSLIARCIIQSYTELDGVILSGTTHPSKLKVKSGILLSSVIKIIYGPKHLSRFMDKIIFGGSQYKKLIKRTSFDWLTRNNPIVGAYINDPYCGFLCTISFYQDLLKLSSLASSPRHMKKSSKNLSILIIAGDKDPVGGYGKEVSQVGALYNKLGFKKITTKLYPDCRHELLFELNSQEIMKDIYDWMIKK